MMPLALKVVAIGACRSFGELHDVADAGTRAVTHDDHRASGSGEQRDRARDGLLRWRDRGVGEPADRCADPRGSPAGSICTSSGSTRCDDAALYERVLAREAHQLPVIGVALHRLREQRDVGERRGEVEVLERAPAAHLRRHLARDREHRRAVDLGVVQAGEQVGRARPGDGEAGGEFAGELAVRRRCERGRAFVADADEREVAARFGGAHRVGEAEVRVARPSRTRGSRPTRTSSRPSRRKRCGHAVAPAAARRRSRRCEPRRGSRRARP